MNIDFTQLIINITEPERPPMVWARTVGDEERTTDLTLRTTVMEGLLTPPTSSDPRKPAPNLSSEDHSKRFELTLKIADCPDGTLDLESPDVAFIRDCVANRWPPLISGQANFLLEGKVVLGGKEEGINDKGGAVKSKAEPVGTPAARV